MTTMTDLNRLAELATDNYYAYDITDENTLFEYLEDFGLPLNEEETVHSRLTRALSADIKDLLHNGNDEDLGWSEADTKTFQDDDDYYDNIDRLGSLIAAKLISRIHN